MATISSTCASGSSPASFEVFSWLTSVMYTLPVATQRAWNAVPVVDTEQAVETEHAMGQDDRVFGLRVTGGQTRRPGCYQRPVNGMRQRRAESYCCSLEVLSLGWIGLFKGNPCRQNADPAAYIIEGYWQKACQ